MMGWGNTDYCFSPGQHYAFRGSMGVPRQCFGALNWLEQRCNGLGNYEPTSALLHASRSSGRLFGIKARQKVSTQRSYMVRAVTMFFLAPPTHQCCNDDPIVPPQIRLGLGEGQYCIECMYFEGRPDLPDVDIASVGQPQWSPIQ